MFASKSTNASKLYLSPFFQFHWTGHQLLIVLLLLHPIKPSVGAILLHSHQAVLIKNPHSKINWKMLIQCVKILITFNSTRKDKFTWSGGAGKFRLMAAPITCAISCQQGLLQCVTLNIFNSNEINMYRLTREVKLLYMHPLLNPMAGSPQLLHLRAFVFPRLPLLQFPAFPLFWPTRNGSLLVYI